MVPTLKKCLALAEALESDEKKLKVKSEMLDSRETDLKQLELSLSEERVVMVKREKNIIPSEKIIKLEFECDGKLRQAKEILADADTRCKNNTEATTVERDRLLSIDEALRIARKKFDESVAEFEELKKDWKEKAIKELVESSSIKSKE